MIGSLVGICIINSWSYNLVVNVIVKYHFDTFWLDFNWYVVVLIGKICIGDFRSFRHVIGWFFKE